MKPHPRKHPWNIPKSTLWTRGRCLSQQGRTPHPALRLCIFCIPVEGLGMATHQVLPTHHVLPFFLVFPHLHNSHEGRMALRGQSRFWSCEKGSKAMGMFTAAGVTRTPVILQDYFSPSREMAGRWILVGRGLFLRDGVKSCAEQMSKSQPDTTRTSRQFRPQDRTQNLPCIYQRKNKEIHGESNTIWEQTSHCFPTILRLFSMLTPDLKSSNSLMSSSFQCHLFICMLKLSDVLHITLNVSARATSGKTLWEGHSSIWSHVQQCTTPSCSMEQIQTLQLHPCKYSIQYCLKTTTECYSHKPSCDGYLGSVPPQPPD